MVEMLDRSQSGRRVEHTVRDMQLAGLRHQKKNPGTVELDLIAQHD